MAQVRDILARKKGAVVTIRPTEPVIQAVRLMAEGRIGAVVVTEGEKVVGVFSERDLVNRVVIKKLDPEKTDIGRVMSTPVAYCTPDTPLEECRSAITQKKIRHLPVVEGGKLVGMISIGDLMAWEIADNQTTIQYLQEYLYGRT